MSSKNNYIKNDQSRGQSDHSGHTDDVKNLLK